MQIEECVKNVKKNEEKSVSNPILWNQIRRSVVVFLSLFSKHWHTYAQTCLLKKKCLTLRTHTVSVSILSGARAFSNHKFFVPLYTRPWHLHKCERILLTWNCFTNSIWTLCTLKLKYSTRDWWENFHSVCTQ